MAQHTESSLPPSGPDVDADIMEARRDSGRTRGLPGWSERAWPSASLRTYLVAMILAATLPIALLLTYKVSADLVQARSRLQSVLGHSAAGLAQTVTLDMASTVDALLALERTDALRSGQPSALERWLRQRPPMKPQWHSVFLATADGRIVFDTARPEGDPAQDAAIEALARKASSEQRAALSESAPVDSARAEVALVVPVRLAGRGWPCARRAHGCARMAAAAVHFRPAGGGLHRAGGCPPERRGRGGPSGPWPAAPAHGGWTACRPAWAMTASPSPRWPHGGPSRITAGR